MMYLRLTELNISEKKVMIRFICRFLIIGSFKVAGRQFGTAAPKPCVTLMGMTFAKKPAARSKFSTPMMVHPHKTDPSNDDGKHHPALPSFKVDSLPSLITYLLAPKELL